MKLKQQVYKFFFSKTKRAYIPLLRMLLVLVTLRETMSVLYRVARVSENPLFYYQSILMDDLFVPLFQDYFLAIKYTFLVAGALSIIGLFTRPALFIYSLLYFAIQFYDTSLGIFNHEASLSSLILFVLVISPGIKNYSLDNLIINRNNRPFWNRLSGKPYEIWSFRLILTLVALGYFTAGVSKVRYGGFDWMDGQTLTFYLKGNTDVNAEVKQKYTTFSINNYSDKWKDDIGLSAYTYGVFKRSETGKWLAEFISSEKAIMIPLSIFTVVFEVSTIFIVFFKRFRLFFLFCAILFHTSIGILMGLSFKDYQTIGICLIDWPFVWEGAKSIIAKRSI